MNYRSPNPLSETSQSTEFQRKNSLIYGCMRLPIHDEASTKAIISQCWNSGFRHFDHADIYNGGASESEFSKACRTLNLTREEMYLTSKCGIRFAGEPTAHDPKRYDFSRRHILESVDASLLRLGTDYLDALLLHRPDFLMDSNEVADAVVELMRAGKVKTFGVSNFSITQLELLSSVLDQPITTNQIEFNLLNLDSLLDGTLDYCQMNGIQIEAWSPLAGTFGTAQSPREERIHEELKRQSEKFNAPPWVIALEWMAHHPARIKSIIGTTDLQRIQQAVMPLACEYSRSDWYRLLEASLGKAVA